MALDDKTKNRMAATFLKWLRSAAPSILEAVDMNREIPQRSRLTSEAAVDGAISQLDFAISELPLSPADLELATRLRIQLQEDKKNGHFGMVNNPVSTTRRWGFR